MVEYVLIIAFIALAVVGLLTTFGTALNQQYDEIDKLVNVTP